MIAERIMRGLEGEGIRARAIPVSRLPQLGQDIVSLRDEGLLDGYLYDTYFKNFQFEAPKDMPDARSLIVLSVPQQQMRVYFRSDGREVPAMVPPTYPSGQQVIDDARALLERLTSDEGGRFIKAVVPLKTLATRTGLAMYGRNNITYVPDQGSFHRLVAFFTDLDLGTDDWQERKTLPKCATCTTCLKVCPTHAIAEDRFLLHVERCLTYHNEMEADHEFPSYIGPEAHNAIVGCLRCQHACPYDRRVRDQVVEGAHFSEEDTAYLLKGEFSGERAKEMDRRLAENGLDLTIFPRNLKALLGQ